MIFTQDIIRLAKELPLQSKKNISSLLAGNLRTHARGSGMQFKEFRDYEAGDDIRHVSWSVTARTGRTTVKRYEEERQLDVVLAVDISGSSLFGIEEKRRIDVFAELVALIGLAALRGGDNFGLILFNESPQVFLPPKRSKNQVQLAVAQLINCAYLGSPSDLTSTLAFTDRLKSRALLIFLSDFFVPPFSQSFQVVAKRHEVFLFHCLSQAEQGSSLVGVYEACDPETGECFVIDGNSRKMRDHIARCQSIQSAELKDLCNQSHAEYVPLSQENNDYLNQVVHFFKQRSVRSYR